MSNEKLSPFDITKNINKKSEMLDVNEVGYDAFVINRVFSNTASSVLFANEMNAAWNLPKDMQYSFYYHALPRGDRYGKWFKNQDEKDDIQLIMDYFEYSYHKAKQVLSLLRPHLPDIQLQLEKGGRRRSHGKRRVQL